MQLKLFTLAALFAAVAPVLSADTVQGDLAKACPNSMPGSVKADFAQIQACTEELSKRFENATAESLATTHNVRLWPFLPSSIDQPR